MNFTNIKNEDLYELCLRGDEQAWGYIYNYILCIVRSPRWRLPDSPEDMAQGIVCHLLAKGIERVKKPRAFRGYVKQVAVNFILDKLKVRKIVCKSIDEQDDDTGRRQDVADTNPGPEDKARFDSLVRSIERSINDLPHRCWEVLPVYIDYKCGLYQSYKAMAEAIGKSIGTLSAQIKRCLDELKMVDEIKIWLET